MIRAVQKIWAISFPLAQCFVISAGQAVSLPDWLSTISGATDITRTETAAQTASSYGVALPPTEVIAHYQTKLRRAGIPFGLSFNGIGSTIMVSAGKLSCIVRVAESDLGSSVRTECATISDSPVESSVEIGGIPAASRSATQPSMQPAVLAQSGSRVGRAEANSDLEAIQAELAAAQKADSQYSGGLTKALTTARIATLRQTEAMLEQRLSSFKAGAPVHSLSASDIAKLADIETDIDSNREK